MPFEYDPAEASECLPPGDYLAELYSCEEKTSKRGNRMLVCVFKVKHADRDWTVTEYIVVPTTLYKLKQMARAWKQMEDFNRGMFDPYQWTGRVITLSLDVEEEENYGDKNRIRAFKSPPGDYVQPASYAGAKPDEIPF